MTMHIPIEESASDAPIARYNNSSPETPTENQNRTLHNDSNISSPQCSLTQIIIYLHVLNYQCHIIRIIFDLYRNPIQPEHIRCQFDGLKMILNLNQIKYKIIEKYNLISLFVDKNIDTQYLYDNTFNLMTIISKII